MNEDKYLGSTVTDAVTGFSGVVTGRVHYLSGCDQVLVVPPVGKDGDYKSAQWFDVQRVTIDASKPRVTLNNAATPGPDLAAPKR